MSGTLSEIEPETVCEQTDRARAKHESFQLPFSIYQLIWKLKN